MTRILKYQPVNDIVADMPKYAKVVKVGAQFTRLTLWVLVTDDDERETAARTFITLPTGAEVPAGAEYLDTLFDDPYVWHIFETTVN